MENASETEALLINVAKQDNGDNANVFEEGKGFLKSLKGVLVTFAQVLLFVASATSVQLLERRIPDLELNTFRNAVPTILYTLGIIFTRKWPAIQREHIKITFLYAVVTFINGLLFFIAVTLLPAGTVSSVVNTSCILFGLVAFSLCLNERITPRAVLLSVLCVCGVVLIIQPWTQSSHKSMGMGISTTEENSNMAVTTTATVTSPIAMTTTTMIETPMATTITVATRNNGNLATSKGVHGKAPFAKMYNGTFPPILGYVFAISSGVTLSLDVLLVKRNPYFNEHILEVLFWIFVSNTFFSFVIMCFVETPVSPSNWFDVDMVAIHSLSYTAIWPFYIYEPNHISGNTVTAIMSTQVAFMLIAQYTVLSSILPGHRNWIEVVGVIGGSSKLPMWLTGCFLVTFFGR